MNLHALLAAPLLATALLAAPGIAAADTTMATPVPLSTMIVMTDDGVAPRLTLPGSTVKAADEALFGKSWFVRSF